MIIKLKSLELENFLSFTKKQSITFPEKGLLLLRGENGSGKSSLLEAIAYVLDYCSTPATELQSFLSEEPLRVKLILDIDGDDCVIERKSGTTFICDIIKMQQKRIQSKR